MHKYIATGYQTITVVPCLGKACSSTLEERIPQIKKIETVIHWDTDERSQVMATRITFHSRDTEETCDLVNLIKSTFELIAHMTDSVSKEDYEMSGELFDYIEELARTESSSVNAFPVDLIEYLSYCGVANVDIAHMEKLCISAFIDLGHNVVQSEGKYRISLPSARRILPWIPTEEAQLAAYYLSAVDKCIHENQIFELQAQRTKLTMDNLELSQQVKILEKTCFNLEQKVRIPASLSCMYSRLLNDHTFALETVKFQKQKLEEQQQEIERLKLELELRTEKLE